MLRPLRPAGLLLALGLCALACVDPHWGAVRWPAQGPDVPVQPVAESPDAGVFLRALAIEWEPQAVVVELEISNLASRSLEVELGAVMLGYGELEYAGEVQALRPGAQVIARLELGPEAVRVVRLRYQLGRPLTGVGGELRLRGLTRDGAGLVDVPSLGIPGYSGE